MADSKIPASIAKLLASPSQPGDAASAVPDSIAKLLQGPGTVRPLQEERPVAGLGDGDFGYSFDVGAAGLKSNLGRAGQFLGLDTGDYAERQQRVAQEASARVAGPQSLGEVEGVGDVFSLASNTIASSLPELALFAAGGLGAGALRGAALAGRGLSKEAIASSVGRARTAGGVAATTPSGTGQAVQSQIEQTGDFDRASAGALGLGYGALNAFGPLEKLAIGKLPVTGARGALAGAGAQAGLGFVKEGAQEAAQGTLTDTLARRAVDPTFDMTSPEQLARRGEEFVLGGLVGGVVSAPIGAYQGYRNNRPVLTPESDTQDLLAADAPVAPRGGLRMPEQPAPEGRAYDTPVQSEDLSGQLGFLPQFNRPDTGMVMQGQAPAARSPLSLLPMDELESIAAQFNADPELPEVPVQLPGLASVTRDDLMQYVQQSQMPPDAQTLDMFTPTNLIDTAERNFGRPGAGLATQELIDQQTGVQRPEVPFNPRAMARRLDEPVTGIEGEDMGTMGDVYRQIADERSPVRPSGVPSMPTSRAAGAQYDIFSNKAYQPTQAPVEQPEVEPPFTDISTPDMLGGQAAAGQQVSARGALRQFLFKNKIKPGSKVGRLVLGSTDIEGVQERLLEAADKAGKEQEFQTYNRAYKALTGRDIDEVIAERAAAQPQGETDELPTVAAAVPPDAVAGPEAAPADAAVQPAGVPALASDTPKQRRDRGPAPQPVATGGEGVPAAAPAAEPAPALTPPDAPAETELRPNTDLAVKPKRKREPKEKLTPAQQQAEVEDEALQATRAGAKDLFNENAEDLYDPQGDAITFDALPPHLQELWVDGDRSIASHDRVVADYVQHVRLTRLAKKLNLRPNTDLGDIKVKAQGKTARSLQQTIAEIEAMPDVADAPTTDRERMIRNAAERVASKGAGQMSPAEADVMERGAAGISLAHRATLRAHAARVGADRLLSDLVSVANGVVEGIATAVVEALRALLFVLNTMNVSLVNTDAVEGYLTVLRPAQAAVTVSMAEKMGEHGGKPFVIVDKPAAEIRVYSGEGKLLGKAPALTGAASGDFRAGGGKAPWKLSDWQKVTPSGTFTGVLAKHKDYGTAVQLVETADGGSVVAIHRPFQGDPSRPARLTSPILTDNKVTQGCISPSDKFYDEVVKPAFAEGSGTVFVLPEGTKHQALGGSISVSGVVGAYRKVRAAREAAKTNSTVAFLRRAAAAARMVEPVDAGASQWLTTLMRDTKVPHFRELMQQMAGTARPLLRQYKVAFGKPVDEDGNPVSGRIDHDTRTITIDRDEPSEDAVLHELLHAAADAAVSADPALKTELRDLMDTLRDKVKGTGMDNALENEREFLNYYFTSSAFRSVLDKVMPSRVDGLLGRIFRLAKRALAALKLASEPTEPLGKQVEARMQKVLVQALRGPTAPGGPGKGTSFMRKPADSATAFGAERELSRGVRAARGQADALFTRLLSNPYVRAGKAKANRLIERLMTENQIVESFAKKLPALLEVKRIREAREAYVNEISTVAGELLGKMSLASGRGESYHQLVDLIYESTLDGFRLDKPVDDPANERAFAIASDKMSPQERADMADRQAAEIEAAETPEKRKEIREKYADRRKARRSAEIDTRRDKFLQAQEKYAAWEKKIEKGQPNLYTAIFDHTEQMQKREFELLLDQAMRRYDRSIGTEGNPRLNEAVREATQLQMQINQTESGEARTKLREQLRDKLNELTDPDVQSDLRQRMELVDDLRRTYEAARNAYFPLMRFGDYLVVARSQKFIDLQAAVEQAQADVERLDKDSPEMQRIRDLRVQLANVDADTTLNSLARQTLVTGLNREIKATEKQIAGTDLAKARLKLAQLQWEVREARKSGEDYQVQYFPSEIDAEKALDTLREQGLEASKHLKEEWASQLDGVGASFIAKLKIDPKMTGDKALAKEFNDIVTRMYLQSQPESSALKRRIAREGIAGYSRDMLKTFAESNRSHAFYASRIKFADKTAEAMEVLRQEAKKGGAETEAVYNTIRRNQILNHTLSETPITDAAARLGAFWYLAFTPAFLAVNLTQNFMVTFPQLASRYGFVEAGRMLLKGMKQTFDAYKVNWKQMKLGEILTFEPNFETSKGLTADERRLFAELQELGKINFTQTMELADRRLIGDLNTLSGKANNALSWAERLGWYLPHHTEIVNRGGAALASYRLARQGNDKFPAMNHEQAVEYAARTIDATHGDYSDSNKPELIRAINKIPGGKILTLFKSFQQMMVFGLFKNARDAFFNADLSKEERAAAARALAGVMGTHAVMAGSMGVPGFASLAMVANAFAGLFGDDDEPYDFETSYRAFAAEVAGEWGGEVLSRGLPRAIPGLNQIDLSGRLSLADLFMPFRYEDDPKKEGRDEIGNVAIAIGGPVAGIAANFADAAAGKGGDFMGTMALVTPKVVADAFKAMSIADKGVTTRAGAPLYDPNAIETIGQALGFRPRRSAESGEMRGGQLVLSTQLEAREQELRDDYYKAKGDPAARRQVEREAREFYRKHPDLGTVANLRKSLAARQRRDAQYRGGRRQTENAFVEEMTSFGNL